MVVLAGTACPSDACVQVIYFIVAAKIVKFTNKI